jgi:hypothetical protein
VIAYRVITTSDEAPVTVVQEESASAENTGARDPANPEEDAAAREETARWRRRVRHRCEV